MRRAAVLVGLLLLLVASPARAQVSELVLDNGLRVLIEPDPAHPEVGIAMAYGMGRRDDPSGHRGLAHLIEHLMFDEREDGGRYLPALRAAGALELNAFVDDDHTVMHATFPSTRYRTGLWVEAHRMAYLLQGLDQAQIDRDVRVIRREEEERRAHSRPLWIAAAFELLVPPSHPYAMLRRTPTGNTQLSSQDLDAMSRDVVAWGVQRYFRPSNATLAVVGDVDLAEVQAEVKRLFGPIVPSRQPEPVRSTERLSPRSSERRGILDERSARNRVVVAWIAPPEDTEELAALLVATEHLRGAFGPLETQIETLDEVHDARLAVVPGALGSLFAIDVALSGAADPQDIVAKVDAMLDESLRRGLSEAWVQAAKRRAGMKLALLEESPARRATMLARHGKSAREHRRRVMAVHHTMVNRVIAQWLPRDGRALLRIEPGGVGEVGQLVVGWR